MPLMKFMKNSIKILTTILMFLFSLFLSLYFGSEKIDFSNPENIEFSKFLLLNLRLPRTLIVLISGILLSSSGAVFQVFFRNELSDPGLLGISGGAALGAVIATLVSSAMAVNAAAFFSALLSGLILILIAATVGKKLDSSILILSGTALGTLCSSITSAILLTRNKEVFGILGWILGSFNGRTLENLYAVFIPAVMSFLIFFFISPALDSINGGEENASYLGVNITLIRILVLLSGSLAVSCAVTLGGTISFAGLIAPHIARRIFLPKTRSLIISSSIIGASLLLISDTLARVMIRPAELPCGIITSFLGVPFFIFIILRGKKNGK